MGYDVIGYASDEELLKVLVENTDTKEQNVIRIGIIEHTGEIVAEPALEMNFEDETDACATAICYLEKVGKIKQVGELE